MSLFSRDKKDVFFELLIQQAENIQKSGREFTDLVRDYRDISVRIKKIDDLEHEGDILTHEVMDRLDRTYITPLDREDIHHLAMNLDDIIDGIKSIADKLLLYQAPAPRKGFLLLVDELGNAVEQIVLALRALPKIKDPTELLVHIKELNRIEDKADDLFRHCIGKLFETESDPFLLLKWKELYENVEDVIDSCEDVAVTLHRIVVKNS